MKCRCLGLDNSRYCTGWCVIDIDTESKDKSYREHMKIVDYGYIDTTSIKQEGKTLIYLEEQFTNLIKDYEPDIIAAEQQFLGKNAQTALVLAGIHAMMKLCAARKNIDIVYYAPMSIKSIVLNGMKMKKSDGSRKTGTELKQEIQQIVFNIFDNVSFENITDDVTDAISIVITYLRQDGKPIGKQSANTKSKLAKKKASNQNELTKNTSIKTETKEQKSKTKTKVKTENKVTKSKK